MAAAQLQLIADVRPVVLDRAVADAEVAGDLFARLVFTDEAKDALLCLCEIAQGRYLPGKRIGPRATVEEIAGDGRADVVFTFHSGLDAAHDFDDGAVLEHEALGAAVQRLVKDVFVFMHREEDNFDGQTALADGASHFKAAHPRHLHIEDRNVGSGFRDERECLLAVFGLADNFHAPLTLDDLAQTFSEKRMIVGEKDSCFSLHRNSPPASRAREQNTMPSLTCWCFIAIIFLQTELDADRGSSAKRGIDLMFPAKYTRTL